MKANKEKKRSSYISMSIRIIGSTSLLFWLIHLIEWNRILEVGKNASPIYLISAFIAIQLTVFSSVWKWKMIVHSSLNETERGNASVMKLGCFYYIGLFFNNFLPGSVGGDVIRVFYLGRITGIPIATASVAFERLTSGFALIVISIISVLSIRIARPFLYSILLVIGIIMFLLLIVGLFMKKGNFRIADTNTKIGGLLEKVWNGLSKIISVAKDYRKQNFKWWILIIMLSLAFQAGLAWINQLLFLSLNIHLPWMHLLMAITLISVITMLPVSVNGIGVREGCYVFFFTGLGVPDEIAVSVSLLFLFLVTLTSVIGGVFWILGRGKQNEAVRESIH
ncbi:lysylphosphatidylglycerol synthase transmembrane domain-containing protein [Bacillus sp. JJ1764]|uniref:lysylphosphatidylglycerol synthase transmembrane domain-containing protein n=1 Tax=Bacillus sp. JJ1764 TaxID=3122964 RepID=UPI002FFE6568